MKMKDTNHGILLVPENDTESDMLDMIKPLIPTMLKKLDGILGTLLLIVQYALKQRPDLIEQLGEDLIKLAENNRRG